MSDFAEAFACFEHGLALYRALEDRRGIAWSIRGCAFVHMLRDRYAAAEEQLNESLEICRAGDDPRGLASSLYALAFLRLAEGDLARARPLLEDALVHLRREGMLFGVFRTLLALGHTRLEQGNVAEAEALYREGLALSREMPLVGFVTIGLDGLGMVAAATGQPLRAARLWGAAEALRDVTDEQRWHVFQDAYDRALEIARLAVVEVEWSGAWTAGRAMTVDQAVAEALTDGDPAMGNIDR
jgi:non-specific serine/threonine protein kinase